MTKALSKVAIPANPRQPGFVPIGDLLADLLQTPEFRGLREYMVASSTAKAA